MDIPITQVCGSCGMVSSFAPSSVTGPLPACPYCNGTLGQQEPSGATAIPALIAVIKARRAQNLSCDDLTDRIWWYRDDAAGSIDALRALRDSKSLAPYELGNVNHTIAYAEEDIAAGARTAWIDIHHLAVRLRLPYKFPWQDWQHEVPSEFRTREHLEQYVGLLYRSVLEPIPSSRSHEEHVSGTELWLLVQLTLSVANEHVPTAGKFNSSVFRQLRAALVAMGDDIAPTLEYWACVNSEDADEWFPLTPFIHEIADTIGVTFSLANPRENWPYK
jgi:hypothetical protein